MAGSPKGEGPKNGNGKQRDDLTRIEGIGEAKAQWLKSIGIVTIHDLACASPDYLESRLKTEGHVTGRNEIEKKWIAQAQKLVDKASRQGEPESAANNSKHSPKSTSEESESSQSLEAAAQPNTDAETTVADVSETLDLTEPISEPTEPGLEPTEPGLEPVLNTKTLVNTSPEAAKWSTFASFAVEFQGRQVENLTDQRILVRHVETDTVESWSSIEGEHFQQWMLSQVTQARPPGPVTHQPTMMDPVVSEIKQLRLLQPPETRMPMLGVQSERMVSNSVRQNEPFSLEVTFSLSGESLADIAATQTAYCIQWDAKNLAPPHEIIALGDTEPQRVNAGQSFYTIRLPEASLQAGIYRLQILLFLRGIAALPTFFDALVLQVV
ncbi:MAG: DUF4332 domain-containing protein [Leptolyngbyaceae cyanobacterium MO_188.B28]|nr:DUF4332 domain-containing protein [Leptolyngbyaceae cyanobacterium MO_188.B28]